MKSFLKKLLPFIFIGLAISLFALGLVIFFYLFLISTAVGIVLFLVSMIKQALFQKKPPNATKIGRTIDADSWIDKNEKE